MYTCPSCNKEYAKQEQLAAHLATCGLYSMSHWQAIAKRDRFFTQSESKGVSISQSVFPEQLSNQNNNNNDIHSNEIEETMTFNQIEITSDAEVYLDFCESLP